MKIEVANGEIVDKFTILSIKLEKITAASQLENIRREYHHLHAALKALNLTADDPDLVALKAVNLKLWDIEDRIRLKEADRRYDQEFIELARSVYINNDRRAELKRRINLKTGSLLVEEKAYVPYR
jgi:2-oxoglutarate dehydrogenase complex dehydrogenase (E1) component-like enzyme